MSFDSFINVLVSGKYWLLFMKHYWVLYQGVI